MHADNLEGLLARVRARVDACTQEGDASSVLEPAALDEATELWLAAQLESEPRLEIIYVLAWLHWCRYLELSEHLDQEDLAAALKFFTLVGQMQSNLVPDRVAGILGMTPPAYEDPANLYNRGVHLFNDFEQTGDRSEIDQAVTLLRMAAHAIPADHPRRGLVLSGLGGVHMARFEAFGETADLDQAIDWGGAAVQATPAGQNDRPGVLTNLGMAYLARYQRFGRSTDLDEATCYCTEAAQLADSGRPGSGSLLANAGLTYRVRFERIGDEADLSESMRYFEAAGLRTPADDTELVRNLANLAGGYQLRFTWFGDATDLSKATERWEQAERASRGHADHPRMLSGLGLAYRMRFEQFGADGDLDEAIRHSVQALREASAGHTAYPGLLSNCAVTYKIRFERFQDRADLDEARRYMTRAVQVTPESDLERAKYLCGLGALYQLLFQQTGRIENIEEAVRFGREGLKATPTTHEGRAMRLSDLGLAYRIRFEQTKAREDLRQAIRHGQEAVDVTPSGHPERAMRLSNLALAYLAQYQVTEAEKDLDRAIRYGTEAVVTTTGDHPDCAMYLSNLASAYRAKADHKVPKALDEAISCWRRAVASQVAPTHQRVRAAIGWGIACETLDDPALAAEAFAAAVRLLPLLAWRGLDRSVREQHLADVGGLVTDAAAWAIEGGNLESAVELLEQGRSVLWSQILQLRTDLTRLKAVNKALASRLDEVRAALDRPGAAGGAMEAEGVGRGRDQELIAGRHRELAREWDDLVGQVRDLQGFETFLEATPFSRLGEAGSAGPVVVVNVSNRRCDALIMTATGVRLCPLLDLTADECSSRADALLNALYPRAASAEAADALQLERIRVLFDTMSWLWDAICEPVVKDLRDCGDLPRERPVEDETPHRVWWCPTGPLTMLPLHAAGRYTEPDGEFLSQVDLSSYTPTVEALLRSRERERTDTDVRVLAVGMPTTPSFDDLDFRDLPAAPRELALLTDQLTGVNVKVLRSPTRDDLAMGRSQEDLQPTRDRVMQALQSHSWAHFACHAGQDLMDPEPMNPLAPVTNTCMIAYSFGQMRWTGPGLRRTVARGRGSRCAVLLQPRGRLGERQSPHPRDPVVRGGPARWRHRGA